MKTKIRIMALSVLFMISLSILTPVLAMTQGVTDTAIPIAKYEEYADGVIKDFMALNGIVYTSELKLSNPIPVDNDNDGNNRAIFLFRNSECIGMMMITFINGKFTSSFSKESIPAITSALNESRRFSLVSSNDALWIVTDGIGTNISGRSDAILTNSGNRLSYSNENQTIVLKQISASVGGTVGNTRAYSFLNVPIVSNAAAPDGSSDGICWAAAMASIIRYNGGASSITATSLYNKLKNAYSGTPSGSCAWVSRCFSLYGISYTHKHSGANFYTVKGIIDSGKPIYCWLTRTGGAHSVVISGYESGYGNYYYRLVDSNKSGVVTVHFTDADATSFTYATTYGYTYTGWVCRMY